MRILGALGPGGGLDHDQVADLAAGLDAHRLDRAERAALARLGQRMAGLELVELGGEAVQCLRAVRLAARAGGQARLALDLQPQRRDLRAQRHQFGRIRIQVALPGAQLRLEPRQLGAQLGRQRAAGLGIGQRVDHLVAGLEVQQLGACAGQRLLGTLELALREAHLLRGDALRDRVDEALRLGQQRGVELLRHHRVEGLHLHRQQAADLVQAHRGAGAPVVGQILAQAVGPEPVEQVAFRGTVVRTQPEAGVELMQQAFREHVVAQQPHILLGRTACTAQQHRQTARAGRLVMGAAHRQHRGADMAVLRHQAEVDRSQQHRQADQQQRQPGRRQQAAEAGRGAGGAHAASPWAAAGGRARSRDSCW